MEARLDERYAPRQERVVSRHTNDEMVLVDMQSGVYHGLNAVGASVWEAMDGKRTLHQISRQIAADYPDVEPAEVQADVLALTQTLLDNELVTPQS